ncbi:LysM peptidoglycan-binding domain-containing protein [Planktomarina sp.]|nr:LysM peptidoglycan-binding domain-containing protein [Planktomarina sp.]MDB4841788.1 LysM peptidoglycan-binding domain-containing protein [Planktomarina sp.]
MTLTDKNKVTAKSRNTVVIIAGVIGLILLWWFYPQIRAAMDPVREVSSVEDSVIPAAETSDAAAEPKPVADIETATDSPNEEDAVAVPDPATSEAASADTSSESQSAESSSDAPAEPLSSKLAAPKFDVVRIEANGSALIAGQADGRGYVVLSIDGVEQPEARADLSGNGQFVIFAFLPPTADQRSLKLHLYTEDGSGPIASVQTVFVAPATAVSSGTESTSAEVEEEVAASEDQDAETEMASTGAKATNLEADAVPVVEADAAPVVEVDAEADAAPVAEVDAEADAAPVAENVTAPKVSEPESDMGSIDTGSTNAEADSTPTTVILADEDGVRVLQDGAPTEVTPAVAIDTISYSSDGGVILGGRGQAGNFVRIYLNNQYIATSGIAVDGYWALKLSDIEPGIYTLRIDELNLAGDVVSRAETPFKREAAEDLAELMAVDTEVEEPLIEVPSESTAVVKAEAADAQPAVQTETETAPEKPLAQAVTQVEVNVQPEVAELDGQDEQSSNGGSAVVEGLPAETAPALRAPSKKFRVRTVQPGSTLWAIAKESYGAGIEYFKVFEANKERIRNPDLIYPGQVFEIPD